MVKKITMYLWIAFSLQVLAGENVSHRLCAGGNCYFSYFSGQDTEQFPLQFGNQILIFDDISLSGRFK